MSRISVKSAVGRDASAAPPGGSNMAPAQTLAHTAELDTEAELDAVIIGAGVSGLYQLYKLRELGLRRAQKVRIAGLAHGQCPCQRAGFVTD